MKPKMILKISVDIGMTIALLFLMSYEMVGQAAHEWLGIGMFVLFIFHHFLNLAWSRSLFKGRYTFLRIWQTLLVVLVLASMVSLMFSGMVLSRHALSFVRIRGLSGTARTLHLLGSYWGFVWMSLHLGYHWSMMMGMARRMTKKASPARTWVLRVIALAIALYGVYAFVKRDVASYMFLVNQFVFFDFEEPLILFLLDYMAVMGLFVFAGHYFTELLRRMGSRRKKHE